MLQQDLKTLLDNAPVLVDLPDSKAVEQMQDLLNHPAIPLLWGLMLGARQAMYQQLENAPLGNMAEISRAGVLQGMIKSVALFHDTVLEQAIPSQDTGAQ